MLQQLDWRNFQNSAMNNRLPDSLVFRPPEYWVDERFEFSDCNFRTVDTPISVSGLSTFGGHPMELTLYPRQSTGVAFSRGNGFTDATPMTAKLGAHNIQVGEVKIVEHPLALWSAMGLAFDAKSTTPSLPSFPECTGTILDALAHKFTQGSNVQRTNVKVPVCAVFPNGAYAAALPDEGQGQLILDHQISHARNCIGAQRVIYKVTPGSFAYIARARPMSYGWKGWVMKRVARVFNCQRLPWTGLSYNNFVVVGDEIYNPNPAFEVKGSNREPLMHEVIDKLGAISLLPGRVVGTFVFFRTSHAQDVEFMRLVADCLV